MPDYRLFDRVLRSELDLPELRPSEGGAPTCHVRVGSVGEPPRDERLVGTLDEPPCSVRLYRGANDFRLEHRCTGSYRIEAGGSRITCQPRPDADDAAVRWDVLGRVIAVALHADGALCLHGSAVHTPAGVVAFLAAKGTGKSTLASALLTAGARLVTDDLLAVETSPEVRALPGIHRVRLRDDSADHALGDDLATRRGVDGKHVVDELDADRLLLEPAPLAAIYVLQPAAPTQRDAVARAALPLRHAALALMSHGKLGPLLGGSEAPVSFDRAMRVAAAVPIATLAVARDLGLVADVAETILEWHGSRPCVAH